VHRKGLALGRSKQRKKGEKQRVNGGHKRTVADNRYHTTEKGGRKKAEEKSGKI